MQVSVVQGSGTQAKAGAGIWAVYKLLTKYLLRSVIGPFLAFFLPLILHVILGFLITPGNIFGGIATNLGLLVGFLVLPSAVIQIKGSAAMKMLGASPVRPWAFSFAVGTYFLLMLVLAEAWLCCWSLIIFGTKMVVGLGTVAGFWAFAFGTIVNGAVCMCIGCLIVNVAKSSLSAQVIGLIAYFPISFLTGQFIPSNIYATSDAILWIGRLMPFHYAAMWNMQATGGAVTIASFNAPDGIFNLNEAGTDAARLTLSDTNAFAYADHFSSVPAYEAIAKNAAAYNLSHELIKNGPDGIAGALAYQQYTFAKAPDDRVLVFSDVEHAVAYAYYFVTLAVLAPVVWRTFR